MGPLSSTYPPRRTYGLLQVVCVFVFALLSLPAHPQTVSALSVPLLLPTGVAFDAQGNLYIAETNRHVIRRVDATGALTTVAGTTVQGYAGDGGLATAAQLDSPTAIVLDATGNLYIADTHNHRVRRVDAATHLITTVAGTGTASYGGDAGPGAKAPLNYPSALAVDANGNLYIADTNNHRVRKLVAASGIMVTVAGNGQQGFAGDGGLATAAAIDSPSGMAVDGAGNLYLADTHNQRLRRVIASTGLISTLAGTGVASFGGDNGMATGASLALPHGVTLDSAGNVYVADTNNHRMRRISAGGTITTVAGNGVQAFLGDGGQAVAASMDTPRGMALSLGNLPTLGDTGNQRVRQIEADGTIVTVGGPGTATGETLTLSGSSTDAYGSGTLVATLSAGAGSGSVTFLENVPSGPGVLATASLTYGSSTLSTASLAAGTHSIYATYPGDLTHGPATSSPVTLTIYPAPVTATAGSVSILYGQPVPALSGALHDVLPQDTGRVALQLTSGAGTLSPVGSYPVAGSLSGAAAGNYALVPLSGAAVVIAKAPTAAALSTSALTLPAGASLTGTVHVASTTTGTPTGTVAFLDGSAPLATILLSASGDASYSSSTLLAGTHTLTAVYSGDADFNATTTAGQTVAVVSAPAADFTLAAMGTASQTVSAGMPASFGFTVQVEGGALTSPIVLAASLPAGTTATFNPATLPPGVTAFTLTVQTAKPSVALSARQRGRWTMALAVLLLPWLSFGTGNQRRRLWCLSAFAVLFTLTGCGATIIAVPLATVASYPITVSGTATSPSGAVLRHTATVTLTVQ